MSVFKEFLDRIEREFGQKLKVVQTNNGGEYRRQFEEYCQSQGIRLKYIVLKTPELNGLAERMNQTIMERVWSMLAHAKLSKIYWTEALTMVVYVLNKSHLVPLEGNVPQKVWSEKEVTCRYPKVFGCLAYVHIAKDQRGKIDPPSTISFD